MCCEHISTLFTLSKVNDTVLCKKIVDLTVGMKDVGECTSFFQDNLIGYILGNDKLVLDYLSKLMKGYQMEFWHFCWSTVTECGRVENFKELFRLRDDEPYAFSYAEVYDGLFYIFRDDLTLEVYNLDGIKKDTLNVVNDLIIPEEILHCDNYNRKKFYIFDNEILLYYTHEYFCPQRVVMNDASDALNTVTYERPAIHDFVLKYSYSIDYNVIKKDTKNGDFTYTSKNDGDGKEYIELNIKPNEGYSIKEIIVTDVNGNKIEVTDNKFIMPMSDVKVEVKYEYGEYVPIPDTFLGKSVTLIFIGLILVSLGLYTINYVRQE
jgi:hypothetical protein